MPLLGLSSSLPTHQGAGRAKAISLQNRSCPHMPVALPRGRNTKSPSGPPALCTEQVPENAFWDFPGGAVDRNPAANAGDTGSTLGLGRFHLPRGNQARAPKLLGLHSSAVFPPQ